MNTHNTLIFVCLYFCTNLLTAQPIPSFPGAEGFGAQATGGRGGRVIYVTNLNANGPGSLNAALSESGPRYILFKVSGVIDAAAELREGDVTIAGQTSPGGIITRGFIVDQVYETGGSGDNIIMRHIRSRPHDPAIVPSDHYVLDDALRLDGASNMIVDHCSFANARDECIQISQSSDITIQHSMLSETVGPHYIYGGMLINYSTLEHPQDNLSIHHNTWNRIAGRLPEVICESPYCNSGPLHLELSNNLLWDPQNYVWYGANIDPSGEDYSFFVHMNWVNNFMKTRTTFPYAMMEMRFLQYAQNQIYGLGNNMDIYPMYSDYQLFYCCNDFNQPGNNPNNDPGIAQLLSNRHNFPSITYDPSNNLVDYMIANCGAFPRDPMDTRLMNPLVQNIIEPLPVDGVDYFNDAFITNAPTTPPDDTDMDGMPDYWELGHGLNPSIQDHNGTQLSLSITGVSGYTNLECYLNCLSDGLVNGQSTPSCGIVLPVILKNFEVKKYDQTVILMWKVTEERNFSGYSIERSKDGKVWTTIGYVEASTKENANANEVTYDYMDDQPMPGVNYYRIKMSDKDGSIQYSLVKQATFQNHAEIDIYPNPTTGIIYFNGLKGKADVQIADQIGKIHISTTIHNTSNKLDVSNLINGMYFIKVTTEYGNTITKKVMKN